MLGLKRFNLISCIIIATAVIAAVAVNIVLFSMVENGESKYYLVEVNRLYDEAVNRSNHTADYSGCKYVYSVKYLDATASDAEVRTFYDNNESRYLIKTVENNGHINGYLKFSYRVSDLENIAKFRRLFNIYFAALLAGLAVFLLYVRLKILRPFNQLSSMPYELSKGHLTKPLPESRNKFFGRFLWGLDLLRANLEDSRTKQYELEKEKKTLVLSISHDIKTPLSAIKLFSRALYEKLYEEEDKQLEAARAIERHADEIESFVSEIISASKEDFLNIQVQEDCYYLKELVERLSGFYKERLGLLKTGFFIGEFSNCLVHGDIERSMEAFENIMENAIKYGDGREISIRFSKEEGYVLMTVSNTGCTLPERETIHMFESFWRGSNAKSQRGSGLGLYICKQIFQKMGGDIYTEVRDGRMEITALLKME